MIQRNQFDATTQLRLSPFFNRTSKLNESQEWRRWSGYLSATNYELNHENEAPKQSKLVKKSFFSKLTGIRF